MDKKIQEKLGSNLITIATYGKDNERKVVVVNNLDATTLKQLKPIFTSKKPLILTKEELTDGNDVFPLDFLNIKLNHHITFGEDTFNNLNFEKTHIRRQLEFEFRSKLINLRQGYLEIDSKKEKAKLIDKALPTLLPILNGLLFLKDVAIPASLDEILSLVSEHYKVNVDILKNVKSQEYEEVVSKLITLLSELGETLDEMKV